MSKKTAFQQRLKEKLYYIPREFTTTSFAIVMATGAVTIDTFLFSMPVLALVLTILGTVVYIWLWLVMQVRMIQHPTQLIDDLKDHTRGPGFFALVAATSILGTQWMLVTDSIMAARILWFLALALWVIVMYSFFFSIIIQPIKPTLEHGLNGTWLLISVSTQSVAILAVLLPWPIVLGDAVSFFALCLFLLGCMLYLIIITLILYRLLFINLAETSLTPPYWINMGAAAITTLTGSVLLQHASSSSLIAEHTSFIKAVTILFWAMASWWIPLLLGLSFWRHIVRRYPIHYDVQLWSTVFPLGMYTTGTLSLANALNLGFLRILPSFTIWISLGAWLVVSLAMFYHLYRGMTHDA